MISPWGYIALLLNLGVPSVAVRLIDISIEVAVNVDIPPSFYRTLYPVR